MGKTFHREIFLRGPAGQLEASLWVSEPSKQFDRTKLVGLVCHPHPLYGGTMHNKVVFRAARTLREFGLPVLRFNFRGAGLSEGEHDSGNGEQADVRAALLHLSREFPGSGIVLVGFSFGAWVGLRVGCEQKSVTELIGLGLPANDSDLFYLADCAKPKLFVQGARDQYGSRDRVESLYAHLPEPKHLVLVADADHFFTGQLDKVGRAIRAWMRERHPELAEEA